MPAGSYLLSDGDGPFAVERFASAAGPLGWRYAATRRHPVTGAPLGGVDLVLDRWGRVLRLQVTTAGWELRGGAVGERELLWRRGEQEHTAVASGFTGTSPAFALATVRRVVPPAAGIQVRLAQLGDAALAVLLVDQRWRALGAHYEVTDLATGAQGVVRIEADLVVAAPGAVLVDLDRSQDIPVSGLTGADWQP